MQIVKLCLDHQNFHCPVTGQRITSDETYEPSPAMVFMYLDEIGEFQDIDPDLQEVFDEVESEFGDELWPDELFAKFCDRIQSEGLVCFEIATHGMACGPVSSTVRIGIDMNYQPQDTCQEHDSLSE
jgi:hypothetical protein